MKQGKNRYYVRSRIAEACFRRLVRAFALDFTAAATAKLTGLSVRPVNDIFLKIRRRLAVLISEELTAEAVAAAAERQCPASVTTASSSAFPAFRASRPHAVRCPRPVQG